SQGTEALEVARAGLHRFVAEQLGVVGDSVTYALSGGTALVTSRRLFEKDSLTDLYYIRSEGTVSDVFSPAAPARRVVGAYAYHRRRPLPHHAALVTTAQRVEEFLYGEIDGDDHASAGDCPGGGTAGVPGAVALSSVDGGIEGNPAGGEVWPGYVQAYDSVGLRWDVLQDPDLPVDFEGPSPPDFSSLPPDSFPVVRVPGDLTAGQSWSGRGVLIVPGTFRALSSNFYWDGIILAGAIADINVGNVRGTIVAGLDGANPAGTVRWALSSVEYHSCNVYEANESLSYLELLEGTEFEVH
ncbi:MAG TPA: hypothetical protein VF295_02470, partial [Candidatus Limnocylindria bacterium]